MTLRVAGGPVRGRRIRGGRRDPVIQAGGLYLTDPANSYTRPGLPCLRSGTYYLPQRDGSLALVPENTPGRYWDSALGMWLYRNDPGWTNSFGNKSVGGGLTLGVGSMTGLSGRPLNKATVPASTFNYAQVGGASTLAFSAAQGQSVDLSFQGYVGAPTGPMSLGLNVVNALTTGLSANAAYNGFKISATGVVFGKFLAGGVTELQAPIVEQVAPGLWKFSWLLRYTQGATVRDNTRMYLEVLDSSGAANNVAGDGVSAVYWELCQHSLTSYHPPIADTITTPVTVSAPSWGATLASLGIALGSEYTLGAEYALAALIPSYQPLALSLSDSGFNESIYLNAATLSANREPNWAVIDGGVGQANSMGLGPASVVGALRRTALRVRANDFRSAFNGALTFPDTSGTLPTLDRLYVGTNWQGSANNALQGGIGRTWIIPASGASDSLLQALATL